MPTQKLGIVPRRNHLPCRSTSAAEWLLEMPSASINFVPTIQRRLQLWDAASSWRQRLLFPIDGLITDSLQGLDTGASQNAARYAVDAWPLASARTFAADSTDFWDRFNGRVAYHRLPGTPCPVIRHCWRLLYSPRPLPGVCCCFHGQHRRVTALALWGSGFITASVATTLIIVLRLRLLVIWRLPLRRSRTAQSAASAILRFVIVRCPAIGLRIRNGAFLRSRLRHASKALE